MYYHYQTGLYTAQLIFTNCSRHKDGTMYPEKLCLIKYQLDMNVYNFENCLFLYNFDLCIINTEKHIQIIRNEHY